MMRSVLSLPNKTKLVRNLHCQPRNGKIYEFRAYDCAPQHMGRFIQMTNEHIHLRTAHSKLIGYWNVEFGSINGVQHIWEYDSLAQRAKVRAALATDAAWNDSYFTDVKPMWLKQSTFTMFEAPWFPLRAPSTEGGLFEIVQTTIVPGAEEEWSSAFSKALESWSSKSTLLGVFYTDSGPLNTVVQLWRHSSPDDRVAALNENVQSPAWTTAVQAANALTRGEQSTLLSALPFSPLK